MKKKNKVVGIIFIGLVVIWVSYNLFKAHQFKLNYSIAHGNIYKIDGPGWKSSGDYAVLYEYFINGKKFTGNNNYNFCGNLNFENLNTFLKNKTFPVLYSNTDNSQCILILTKSNAQRYNYNLPDSLLVYDSILTCK